MPSEQAYYGNDTSISRQQKDVSYEVAAPGKLGPRPPLTAELSERIETLRGIISDIDGASADLRGRLLGPGPTEANSREEIAPTPAGQGPGLVMMLDALISLANRARENVFTLNARV